MNRVLYFKTINDLNNIAYKYKKIYLYGAGIYGEMYKQILDINKVKIAGFIVSNKTVDECCGIPVFNAKDRLTNMHSECCVIMSLSKKFRSEVLRDNEFQCDVYCIEDGLEKVFSCLPFFCLLEKMGRMYGENRVIDLHDGGNILVVQIEFTFGDVIWSTAFIRELRLNFPRSNISFIINKKMVQLISECPYIDEAIPYPLERGARYIAPDVLYEDCKSFCAKINKKFDAVFLPRLLPYNGTELWENVFISQCVDANNVFAHALADTEELDRVTTYYEPFFSKIIKHIDAEHEAKRDLSLIHAFGGNVKNDAMELWTNLEADDFARSLLKNGGKQTYIAVGLVGSNPVRSWPAYKYNELFKKISECKSNVKFVLCGGLDAKEAALTASIGNESACVDVTVKTNLLQVVSVIKRCNFYIGADTGLMHVASACGKPVIMLSHSLPDSPPTYGSSPTRTGPWRVPNVVFRPPHALGNCRYVCSEKYPHCISLIEVDDVFDSVMNFIDSYGEL